MTAEVKSYLVCGGRGFDNQAYVSNHLNNICTKPCIIIEGGAKGADRLGRLWAFYHGNIVKTIEADWQKHGKAAGPIRNKAMLDICKPDMVIAFAGGRGTANMKKQAKAAGIKVMEF